MEKVQELRKGIPGAALFMNKSLQKNLCDYLPLVTLTDEEKKTVHAFMDVLKFLEEKHQ